MTKTATGALDMRALPDLRWRIEHALRVEGVEAFHPSTGLTNPGAQQVLQRILDEVECYVRDMLGENAGDQAQNWPWTPDGVLGTVRRVLNDTLVPISTDELHDLLQDEEVTLAEPALERLQKHLQRHLDEDRASCMTDLAVELESIDDDLEDRLKRIADTLL